MLRLRHRIALLILISIISGLATTSCGGPVGEIILATTTSTYDSSLLDEIIPHFEKSSGYTVKIVAVGTGKALQMGRDGNADLLLVHAPAAEKGLMAEGYGSDRRLVMHNDFVIVGPGDDPADIKGIVSAGDALRAISEQKGLFISRGDDSGTNKKELILWQEAGSAPEGDWYLESGQGMGATLRLASEKGAYTLTDRGTYLALRDGLELDVLSEGDPLLLNIYHVMLVNPERWPEINVKGAEALADYLTSREVQDVIRDFGVSKFGQPLFVPDAGKTEEELTG